MKTNKILILPKSKEKKGYLVDKDNLDILIFLVPSNLNKIKFYPIHKSSLEKKRDFDSSMKARKNKKFYSTFYLNDNDYFVLKKDIRNIKNIVPEFFI